MSQFTLETSNKQHRALQFTNTEESDKQMSYTDLTISSTQETIKIDIYRKSEEYSTPPYVFMV
jgi:hypothetical protein